MENLVLVTKKKFRVCLVCVLLLIVAGSASAQSTWTFQAESLSHLIGRADGVGWSVNVVQDTANYMCYGPYTTAITGGPNCASFRLMIDGGAGTDRVLQLHVYDATTSTLLASRDVYRNEFAAGYTYQNFDVNFVSTSGHMLEFRTYWYGTSYINEDYVLVTALTQSESTFEAENLTHWVGRADGVGWSANVAQDSANWLCIGPATTSISAGLNRAIFRMKIDTRTGTNDKVATIDIFDSTSNRILSNRDIYRNEFTADNTYQDFVLNFTSMGGHTLEFRTYWYDAAYINEDYVKIASQTPPTLTDFWNGQANFAVDAYGVGANIGFHFSSMIWEGSQLTAYYIASGASPGLAIGRALSDDGVTWTRTPSTAVVDVGGASQWAWNATDLSHLIGRVDGDGWSVNVVQDTANWMCYGPYTAAVAGGSNCASFRLMIDGGSGTDRVLTLEVNDATTSTVLASRNVTRNEFTSGYTYQDFKVNFTSTAGHMLEFRTYWYGTSYIKQKSVAVTQGSYPFWDGTMASFPGVWKDNGTYYLVYEGSGTSNGDIGLATSTDGINFYKSATNPILTHGGGIESANIGTPSLYKENGTWYLFYHGWDYTDCRICVASGNSLTNLTKYGGNSIINTVSNTWESGTTGRRSAIFKEGSYYYMAYEGSTEAPYSTAYWSSGLARSTNILDWTKCPYNPVISQLYGGGHDGPEMMKINNVYYLYVRQSVLTYGGTTSDRFRLEWNPF